MKTTRQHWAAWLVPAAVLLSNPIYRLTPPHLLIVY